MSLKNNFFFVELLNLNEIDYKTAWDFQNEKMNGIINEKKINPFHKLNKLIFCEHYPVFTIGNSGNKLNLLTDSEDLIKKGFEFYHSNRGGDVTFHGKGQIVGYLIFDLDQLYKDLHKFIRNIEEVIILSLKKFGITGERFPKETGVWVKNKYDEKLNKIAAIGVRCSRWVTLHGFALNVNTNLEPFNYIIPCGIKDKFVTTIAKETGIEFKMNEIKEELKINFQKIFNIKYL